MDDRQKAIRWAQAWEGFMAILPRLGYSDEQIQRVKDVRLDGRNKGLYEIEELEKLTEEGMKIGDSEGSSGEENPPKKRGRPKKSDSSQEAQASESGEGGE